MNIKPLKKPLRIKKLEALLRRLSPSHPKKEIVEKELKKSLAGYKGEESLIYYLSFLPEDKYYIFHDLRLTEDQDRFFQIDILILSTHFFLILEVKNIRYHFI